MSKELHVYHDMDPLSISTLAKYFWHGRGVLVPINQVYIKDLQNGPSNIHRASSDVAVFVRNS